MIDNSETRHARGWLIAARECLRAGSKQFRNLLAPGGRGRKREGIRCSGERWINTSYPVLTVPPCRPSCTSDPREIWWSDGYTLRNTSRTEMGLLLLWCGERCIGSVDVCCVLCLVYCAVTEQQCLTAAVCITVHASCFDTAMYLVV